MHDARSKEPPRRRCCTAAAAGLVNIVTTQPLRTARHGVEAGIGSFGHRTLTLDSTGPLNSSGSVRYRLTAATDKDGNFVHNTSQRSLFDSPAWTSTSANASRRTLGVSHVSACPSGIPNDPAGSLTAADVGCHPIPRSTRTWSTRWAPSRAGWSAATSPTSASTTAASPLSSRARRARGG